MSDSPFLLGEPLLGLLGAELKALSTEIYCVEALLAAGSYGLVVSAVRQRDGEPVAVKLLRPHLRDRVEIVGRFAREARAAATVHHPHVAAVVDRGLDPQWGPFAVQPLLPGAPLPELAAKWGGWLPWPLLDQVAEQAGSALVAIHAAGIIHRDLKPDNLLVQEHNGKVQLWLLDFGLAKLLRPQAAGVTVDARTRPGQIVGTPAYMSPEQVMSLECSASADLYCLGVVLFEAATGKLPWPADNPRAMLHAHLYEAPATLSSCDQSSWLPDGLDNLMGDLLAKRPSQRPQSAEEFLERWRRCRAMAEGTGRSRLRPA